MDGNFQIRAASIRDAEFVKEIEIECGLAPWPFGDYIEECARPDAVFLTAFHQDKVIGFLLARLIMNQNIIPGKRDKKKSYSATDEYVLLNSQIEAQNLDDQNDTSKFENEAEIFNIGVSKTFRRKNVASLLLERLIKKSIKKKVEKIWLEVRESNKDALRFYELHEFKIVSRRRNLYTNPTEDGYIMRRNFFEQDKLD